MSKIGKRIRAQRRSQKLSVKQIAHCAGVSRLSLHLIEVGLRMPTMTMIVAVADALSLAPGHLFNEAPTGIELSDLRYRDPDAFDLMSRAVAQAKVRARARVEGAEAGL